MKKVKIVNGVYGYRPDGVGSTEPIGIGETVSLPDDEAARLVDLGVAIIVGDAPAPVATPDVGQSDGGEGDDTPEDGNGAEDGDEPPALPPYSVTMKADQLHVLLDRVGIQFKVGMTKADMVAALDAHFAEADEDSDETPPGLGAEDPVT